jgi:hypothetical protein
MNSAKSPTDAHSRSRYSVYHSRKERRLLMLGVNIRTLIFIASLSVGAYAFYAEIRNNPNPANSSLAISIPLLDELETRLVYRKLYGSVEAGEEAVAKSKAATGTFHGGDDAEGKPTPLL